MPEDGRVPLTSSPAAGLSALLLLTVLAAGCSAGAPADPGSGAPRKDSATTSEGEVDLAIGRSRPRHDPVYPEHGEPLVDALHYDLDLTWSPATRTLDAVETLTFRATEDSDTIPLELGESLTISEVSVDGIQVDVDRDLDREAEDLRISRAVRADQTYVVDLAYSGTPATAPAPTNRSDFSSGVGWSIGEDGETWTLQEPYGAFTWYAVNDHPSDKALYDFTLTTPAPWTGVANGENIGISEIDGSRTATWHLAEPAASYLVTVAFDDFQVTDLTSGSGVPIQVWAPADGEALPGDVGKAPEAMAWLEERLGPYPFDTFGILVAGDSGIETQTMVTLADDDYSLSEAVVVHELAHQWYGDTVTPADWNDVWMNEGMAMYLQGWWQAEQSGISVAEMVAGWTAQESDERSAAGPPGDYDPDQFGAGNIYYGPALMWQELRERIGDEAFLELIRGWPQSRENQNADTSTYRRWIERRTGLDLEDFFDDWLLGRTSPATE